MAKSVWKYDRRTGIITQDGKVRGYPHSEGYIVVSYRGKKIGAHRLAYILQGLIPPDMVDHINGIKDDNRWENLRATDKYSNQWNREGKGKGLKGAHHDKRTGKYKAEIMVESKRFYLGTFPTELEAHEAYRAASEKLHGEFSIWKRIGCERQSAWLSGKLNDLDAVEERQLL